MNLVLFGFVLCGNFAKYAWTIDSGCHHILNQHLLREHLSGNDLVHLR